MVARTEFVPAGAQVFADPKWPLASLIAAGRTINTDTPDFARYVTTRPLPGMSRQVKRGDESRPRPPRGRRRARP